MSFQVIFIEIGNWERFNTDGSRFESLFYAAGYGAALTFGEDDMAFKIIESEDPITDWDDGRIFSVDGVISGDTYECDIHGVPFDE